MADPLEAYNQEIQRRSGPFGLDPAQTKGGVALQFPLRVLEGIGGAADYLLSAPQRMGEATLDYLTSPSQYVKDLQSGKISESEIPLGTDLVDIFGDTDPTLGAPDFVTDDYNVGEIFKFDPTGEGKTKGMPETKAEREGREAKKQLETEIKTAVDNQFDQVAAQKEKDAKRAEDFRKKEAQIAEGQGGLKSMTVADSEAVTEQMFASAMQDYIEGVRGTGPDIKDPKSIEEYKEEFAKATGISIDGKPDKSQALMAFGLELMRNKAGGKGVTGMLDAIGVAGQAAMPALEKARERARQDGIAAGKFALEMRSADQAKAEAAKEKAMERSNYFVVPRSTDVKGFLAGIGEGRGRLESLSKYELNKLQNTPEFAEKFDVLPAATWATVVEEAMKTPEAKEYYQAKPRELKLFEGTDAELSFQVYDPTANASMRGVKPFTYQAQEAYDKISDQLSDLEKAEREWADITAQVKEKGVTVFTQTVDGVDSLFESFGINFREGETPTARLRNFLTRVQMQNAPEILGEAGKTISDADRERVAAIVGDVSLLTSEDELMAKMEQVHKFIVQRTRTNVLRNLREVDRYSPNSNFSQYLQGDDSMSDEERDRLAEYNKKYGFTGD